MNRKEAREIALCLIFDYSFHYEEKPSELMDLYLKCFHESEDNLPSEEILNDSYISDVYYGVSEKKDELDAYIQKHSSNWKINRISRVSLSILRLAIYEMLFIDNIPLQVSINEAVELAKKYDHDDSFSFVNGVLGAFYKYLESNKGE